MNFIIIHGTNGHPEKNWFPWLKNELDKLGHTVYIPQFPTPDGQNLANWLKVIEKYNIEIVTESRYSAHTLTEQIWQPVLDDVITAGNNVFTEVPWYLNNFNTATLFQIGKDIYMGNEYYDQDLSLQIECISKHYPDYRWHPINTGGHADGTYSAIKPNLIVSSHDIPGSDYAKLFPDWEVIYVPKENKLDKLDSFSELKKKNGGKWYIPNQPIDDEFVDFVKNYLDHWVGFVEETIFDVNLLVIDEKNVICENYNKVIFDALERHNVTPHILKFRHSHFWDSGLHCVSSDIHRQGTLKDYFPQRS